MAPPQGGAIFVVRAAVDAIVLNRQRACEAAIDLAVHVVRVHRPGLPQGHVL
ncbi:MAG: hypothetical protein L0H83_02285 [Salinisphaera sp.]|nr:hypothetical protein [Salinisphaera sp.]